MTNEIAEVVKLIQDDEDYQEYFFISLGKMKTPLNWFLPLYSAKLISPNNPKAMGYVRLLMHENSLHTNNIFINLILEWLNSFADNQFSVDHIMWFIEAAWKINNPEIYEKCNDIIKEQLISEERCATVIIYLNRDDFNKHIINNTQLVIDLTRIIINRGLFSILSSNSYSLLIVRNLFLNQLYKSAFSDLMEIIQSALLAFLQEDPIHFRMLDTIDTGYHGFSYGDYIMGWLLDIITKNDAPKNLELIKYYDSYLAGKKSIENEKVFILKIIIYLIDKTMSYDKFLIIKKYVRSLDELPEISYALYTNIFDSGMKHGHNFLPDAELWLASLEYQDNNDASNSNKEYVKNYNLWLAGIRLQLLKIFGENRKIYQKLKPEYPYDIEPPQRKIGEVRSSETSINNYLPYIRDCSIEEIIAILNDPDIIKSKVTTDFDKLHLRWAINSDFQNNRDKYSEVNVVRILKEVRNNYTKMWFINNISDLNQNKEGLEYQGVIDILLDQEVNDEYYLMSIISLIDGLFNQGKDLSDYFKRIEEFILSNITSIKDDEKLDELDLGINSIFGRGLRIIIEINLDISNRNFDRFITNFESYQVFFDKLNALYFLGQYLFWLYKENKFQKWFEQISKENQLIILYGFFKGSSYLSKEVFELSKKFKNELLENKEILFNYMNHIFYMYIKENDQFLLEAIDENNSNKPVLEAVLNSIHAYKQQISDLPDPNVLRQVIKKLINSPHKKELSSRILYYVDLLDIQDAEALELFKALVQEQAINNFFYRDEACDKLTKLLDIRYYKDLLEILNTLARNSSSGYYLPILFFDNLIADIKIKLQLNALEYDSFVQLIKQLKQIGYPCNADLYS